jgi:putative addiction module component (TIGR02574 family)
MSLTREQIMTEVMALDPKERQALAQEIWETAINEVPPDVEAAWMDECRRRIGQLDRGEVQAIPGEQVMREAREALRQRRR